MWKKVLIFAVLPALIAGLFSIAPKIYEIIKAPKAELSYSTTEGPGLEIGNGWRKVVSINISNTGKLTQNRIEAEIVFNTGKIESHAVSDRFGLKPITQSDSSKIFVSVRKLHPSEKLSISSMILLREPHIDMTVNIRSDEGRGIFKPIETTEKNNKNELLGGALAGFAVFLMTIITLLMLRRGKIPFPFSVVLSGKQDILFYIAIRHDFLDVSEKISFSDYHLTYLRMADILLSKGLLEGDKKVSAIRALKSLLLIRNIAKKSQGVIISNLKMLEGSSYSEKEIQTLKKNSLDIDNFSKLRQRVDGFLVKGIDSLVKGKDQA